MPRPPLPRLRYLLLAVVAVVAVIGGLLGPAVYAKITDTSAKDRIAAAPPPRLFPATQTARVDTLVVPQSQQARQLMASWWSGHGTTPDDAGFQAWLLQTFPAPPDATARAKEMSEVETLDKQRSTSGVAAATWLEAYGKKDIWKLEAHDQAEYLSTAAGDARENDVAAMVAMTKDVSDALGTKFQQSAPYVLEPSLRTDHVVTAGQVCPCSYPSRHASAGAASRTYLGHFMPQRNADYRWWEDQIDYSRIYMAGHVASDISGGSLLGDMVGDYFLGTRGGVQP